MHDLPLITVTRRLDADVLVGEALFFPEVVAVHASEGRLAAILRGLVRQIAGDLPPLEIHRRMAGPPPAVSRLGVTIDPPRPSSAWREPVTIELDVLRWRHADEASIAFVPALGIEVVAARDDALDELIPKHVRMTLARTNVAGRLFDLAQLGRVEGVTVERGTVGVDVRTPAQLAADRSKEEAESARLVIDEVGRVLRDAEAPAAHEADSAVGLLADALGGRGPKSVLLVGPSGVGKTAAFGELFRQRERRGLQNAAFWATSGARLIAGAVGFGLWQERCQKLCRQAKRAGAVLHLGNLVELMEVGRAGGGGFGIGNFFRPYLARGDVLAVAECTPEQLPLIERNAPQLLQVFEVVRVDEPPPDAVKLILLAAALEFAAERPREFHHTAAGPGVMPISDEGLEAVERLHRRYATYSAAPGRPLRFLRNLMLDHFGGGGGASGGDRRFPVSAAPAPVSAADVTAAFSRETGLPPFLLDDGAPLDLTAARDGFAGRVIGQAEAVDLVTDLLATVKAALNRPRRPIASLLFVGPTGVGKTEMAKALADFFFGGADGGKAMTEDRGWRTEGQGVARSSNLRPPSSSSSTRLLRFDMSEYATPGAVGRLVGTAWDAEGLLTAKVREQPFCVVLLDEFEKADASFFDLLLQMLGEGRLTDSAGRLADFSNAVVVMTSNLGAESFGAGPFGLARRAADGGSDAREHFTEVVRSFLRPELFNRIDRVVPFLPLGPATIEQIAAREIELILRRDGARQRALRLDVSPDALRHLARGGYEPLYGARPLKRKIEQELLAPLADSTNGYGDAGALEAHVALADGEIDVRVRPVSTPGGHGARPAGAAVAAVTTLERQRSSALRRQAQAVARCPAALNVQNELFQLRTLIGRADARPGRHRIDVAQRDRLKRLTAIADAAARVHGEATRIEEGLLLNLYEGAPLPAGPAEIVLLLARLGADAARVMIELFAADYPDPHAVTLGLYGNAPADLFKLARAYHDIATRLTADHEPAPRGASLWYFTRQSKDGVRRTPVARGDVDEFLGGPRGGILGIVLAIRAPFARPRFETESGLHVMRDEDGPGEQRGFWVDASAEPGESYRPPKDVEFRVAVVGQRRRTFVMDREELQDGATGKTFRRAGTMADAIAAAADEHLATRVRQILDPENG